jgi:hypothetical protein
MAESRALELSAARRRDATRFNFPVGQAVIVRSNENNPLIHGIVEDHQLIGTDYVPVVRDLSDNRQLICLGAMAYYSDERWLALQKLNSTEQWLVMTRYV